MSQPTSSRTYLRREISKSLLQEFPLRYPAGVIAATGGTTTTVVSTALTQVENDFWKNGYVYFVTGDNIGEERKITSFTASTDTLTLESALPNTCDAGDTFEIHEIWPATFIHAKINRAIHQVARYYPKYVADETLVVVEDKMIYPLTGLTSRVWTLDSVWVERNEYGLTFMDPTPTKSEVSPVWYLNPGGQLSANQYDDYILSSYGGSGAGVLTEVAATDTNADSIQTLAITPSTTVWNSTTKFRLWNPLKQTSDWHKVQFLRTDFPEYPNNIYLSQSLRDYEGFRLRLIYSSQDLDLSAESSTTTVPEDFLIPKVLGYLYESMMNDSRADSNRYVNLAQYHHGQADKYLKENMPQTPHGTVWMQGSGEGYPVDDPLDWEGHNG